MAVCINTITNPVSSIADLWVARAALVDYLVGANLDPTDDEQAALLGVEAQILTTRPVNRDDFISQFFVWNEWRDLITDGLADCGMVAAYEKGGEALRAWFQVERAALA